MLCWQHPGELLLAWLGRGGCPAKVEKLASVTIQPSLQQHLQISRHLTQGQENHTPMEQITATMWTVWNDAREFPNNVSKWQTC